MTLRDDREDEGSGSEVESTVLPTKRTEPEEEKEIPYKNTLNFYYREESQKSLDTFVTRTKRNDEDSSPKKQRTEADGGKSPSNNKTPSEDRVSPLKQKRVDEFVNAQRDKASVLLSSE
mmetsp:Transcript_1388/g.1837  ORF Transcript_1388/g.1837 Transcript_1388/m.1837 type:complete len:119 (-) Transcript_1388:64-420(-)